MKRDPIDFVGTLAHYLDHMEPVMVALARKDRLGTQFMREWDDEILHENAGRVTVVASGQDLLKASNAGRRRIVMMEHGAGQSYRGRSRGYVGGQDRQKCGLVLVPNEQAAQRHQRYYPKQPPVEVVGCPKVDRIAALPTKLCGYPPHVVVSWHFRGAEVYAGTAWDSIGTSVLHELVRMRDLGMIQLSGHAHPRIIDELRPWYGSYDVPVIDTFAEVLAVADLYMVDNSSTLWEFAATDRPVVVIDSPLWKSNRSFGLRFWDQADVGVRFRDPDLTAWAVNLALEDPEDQAKLRWESVAAVYPHIGRSTERAMAAILRFADQ